MDATSLCTRLLVAVMVLLVAHSAGEAFPRITPDRLQFFEYETIIISCEELMGLTGWRVKTRHNKTAHSSICSPPASSCTIKPVFKRHSGEFWCEHDEGNITGSINISVTAGSVILVFPAHPVMEGSDVTLHCRKRRQTLTHIADFYKDGICLKTKYDNNMKIRNVSKSDEGLYKCSISGSGQSPESWLTVLNKENDTYKETQPPHKSDFTPLLWIFRTLVATLLLVVGLFVCCSDQVFFGVMSEKSARGSHPQEDQTDNCTKTRNTGRESL